MATKPSPKPTKPAPRFNTTTAAIAGSFLLALVLATVVAGNPFRATRLAYHDYSVVPPAERSAAPDAAK